MDEKFWAFVVLMVISLTISFAFGFSASIHFRYEPLQAAAVERGYAEWVVPESGRGETVFQWVD